MTRIWKPGDQAWLASRAGVHQCTVDLVDATLDETIMVAVTVRPPFPGTGLWLPTDLHDNKTDAERAVALQILEDPNNELDF